MDYFRAYLEHGTAFAAMVRGAEAALMGQAGPFPLPLLDLGCGDGFFASLLDHRGRFTGVDANLAPLLSARHTGAYSGLAAASATLLPFPGESFETVMANSVLEHVPDLESALHEISRVLRPRGRLVLTAPSDRFAAMLAGTRLLDAIGLAGLAGRYGRWFNGHSRHFHTDGVVAWEQRLAALKLRVEHSHCYFPAPAMLAFDVAHYLGVPRLVSRALFGRWVAFPGLTLNRVYDRAWRRHADPSPVDDGAYVFIVARKHP
jgi:SAM-dependent methyltransferase